MNLSTHGVVAAAAIGMAMGAVSAHPAERGASSGPSVIEEVVVTGVRKRQERLLDVPAALTVLGEEDLDRYMTRELTDVTNLVPGLRISYVSTGQGGALNLRGLGSTVDAGVENAVALNFDGIQVSRGRFLRSSMFDISSVEVLKGPQALFYGKNSPGGLVSVNSVNPGDTREGFLRVGFADKPGKRFVEGAITLPINDTLSTRIALRYDSEEGWLNNRGGPLVNVFQCLPIPGSPCVHPIAPGPIQGDTRDFESIFGRLTVAWEPTDAFDALFKITYGEFDDNGDVANDQRVCPGPHPVISQAGITAVDTNQDCELDLNTTLASWPAEVAAHWPEQLEGGKPFSTFDPLLTSLTLNYDWEDYTLTSVTGYYDSEAFNQGNSDGNTFVVLAGSNTEISHAFSQEFRLVSDFSGPVNFMLGGFYEDSWRQYQNNGLVFPMASFFKLDVGNGKGYDSRSGRSNDWLQNSTTKGETYSVFGQVIWDITDQLTLEAGARWLDEKKDAEVANIFVNDSILSFVRDVAFLPEGAALSAKLSEKNVSPEVTLSYRYQENMTFYASYKSGFQSGGMSNPGLPGPLPASSLLFEPMESDGFEVGFKFSFPEIVTGDLIIYDYTFDNLQVQSARQVEVQPGVFTVLYTTTNAAAATTRGVELQGNWSTPVEGLSVLTNIAYNKAEFDKYPGAPCTTGATGCDSAVGADLSGKTLPGAPKWDMRIGLSYESQISQDLHFSMSLAGSFEDNVVFALPIAPFTDIPGHGVEDGRRDSLWLFDASARLFWKDRWELALIGTNITNELYVLNANTALAFGTDPSQLRASVNQPRTIQLQMSMHFN